MTTVLEGGEWSAAHPSRSLPTGKTQYPFYRKYARYNNLKQKRENMHTDRCGNTCRQKCCAKGSGKEAKTHAHMYRDATNAEPEM